MISASSRAQAPSHHSCEDWYGAGVGVEDWYGAGVGGKDWYGVGVGGEDWYGVVMRIGMY